MRIPHVLALLGGVAALHFMIAACSGSDTSTAQAGTGAGGAGATSGSGACECPAPLKARSMTVACGELGTAANPLNGAKVEVTGASAQEMLGIRAMAMRPFGTPFSKLGGVYIDMPVVFGDGVVFVACKNEAPMPDYTQIVFWIPPGL